MREVENVAKWVGRNVLPHEGAVRSWLRRASVSPHEIDDLIQEAYCKISSLDDVSHIENPKSYFFQVVRSVLLMQLRRSRIVRIDTIGEMEFLGIVDSSPTPEEELSAFRDLHRLRTFVDLLPRRCREVFVLRKIENVSQKEIAKRLGIAEHTVEAQATKGLKLILKAWSEVEPERARGMAKGNESSRRTRKRN